MHPDLWPLHEQCPCPLVSPLVCPCKGPWVSYQESIANPIPGDFVTVLNLFKDIGVALKDHGGASDDYRRTVNELETIKAILLQLQRFNPADARPYSSASVSAFIR